MRTVEGSHGHFRVSIAQGGILRDHGPVCRNFRFYWPTAQLCFDRHLGREILFVVDNAGRLMAIDFETGERRRILCRSKEAPGMPCVPVTTRCGLALDSVVPDNEYPYVQPGRAPEPHACPAAEGHLGGRGAGLALMSQCSGWIPHNRSHVIAVMTWNTAGIIGGRHLAIGKLNAARVTAVVHEIDNSPGLTPGHTFIAAEPDVDPVWVLTVSVA